MGEEFPHQRSQTASEFPLAEGCIAHMASFTCPGEASRLAVVSCIFKAAADSDHVWDRFFPPDFESILSRSSVAVNDLPVESKKDRLLYFANNHILIDAGKIGCYLLLLRFPWLDLAIWFEILLLFSLIVSVICDRTLQSFWLDKWSGKKCYMLSAGDISIIWGDASQYWKWVNLPESRFDKVAELNDVCWLEITGRICTSMLSPSTHYVAFFVFKEERNGLHGFRNLLLDTRRLDFSLGVKTLADAEFV